MSLRPVYIVRSSTKAASSKPIDLRREPESPTQTRFASADRLKPRTVKWTKGGGWAHIQHAVLLHPVLYGIGWGEREICSVVV